METHDHKRQSAEITRFASEWGRLNCADWDLYYQGRRDPVFRDSREFFEARDRIAHGIAVLESKLGFNGEYEVLDSMHSDFRKLEFAIAFLEFDPIYFNSGYSKARLLRTLRSCPLSQRQRARLQAILLDAATNRPWREYVHYCRLAARIADSELYEALAPVVEQGGPAASRARMMREAIETHGYLADPRNSNYIGTHDR